MSGPAQPLLWGIDIGGTKLAVTIGRQASDGDPDGGVIGTHSEPMDPQEPPSAVLDRAVRRLAEMSEHAGAGRPCERLGVSVPGPFDFERERFDETPNMPRWQGFAIGAFLRQRLERPCRFMNDANAAALAEHRWGAGRGVRSMVFLTMSTGFGAGLVLDGRAYHGPRGLAGEVGRLRLADDGPVGWGIPGTAEGFLSGPGIEQQARAEALACRQRGERTALSDGPTDCRSVCELASSGDPAARRVTDRVAARLGQLAALVACVVDPDRFVLGTIGEAHPDLFIPGAVQAMRENVPSSMADAAEIVPGGLGLRRPALASLAVAGVADQR